MLTLDDPRWASLHGGYRVPYDTTPALRRLADDWTDRAAWEELWSELHHQGDVGEASYAALPFLVELARGAPTRGWNVYALAATIETERHARRNPPLPTWLVMDYRQSWAKLADLALEDLREAGDRDLIRSALAVVALARGYLKLGALLAGLDDSEIDEYLDGRIDWSDGYRSDPGPGVES
jgi:hypothetical protein